MVPEFRYDDKKFFEKLKFNKLCSYVAIREVEEAHKELKEMQDKQMEQRLAKQSKKPPPYKQIKVGTSWCANRARFRCGRLKVRYLVG